MLKRLFRQQHRHLANVIKAPMNGHSHAAGFAGGSLTQACRCQTSGQATHVGTSARHHKDVAIAGVPPSAVASWLGGSQARA
jgi:hypothetical protein